MSGTDRIIGRFGGLSANDPRYWRQRAQETHTLAEQMHNIAARGIMLDIALRYEAMAKSSEHRVVPPLKKAP